SLFGQPFYSRDEDLVLYAFEHGIINYGDMRACAHTAGIGACVAIVGTLVILSSLQRDDMPPVAKRQHTGFFTHLKLLDYDQVPCITEDSLVHNRTDGHHCFLVRLSNRD